MMQCIPLHLPGLLIIRPKKTEDNRGSFVKNYNADLLQKAGVDFIPRESFYSVSLAGVLRGMHFQRPPQAYGKLVTCVRGKAHDVVLDLRAGSPTFGKTWSGDLDDVSCEALYLPPGFAHGLYAYHSDTIISYLVSEGYDPQLDDGIRWDTIGYEWPCQSPIISSRDSQLAAFQDFSTPFSYT